MLRRGFEGFYPTHDDWELHSNLYFPEVRLRNFIEIRNHDCVGNGLEYSIPAFYKGIMYSNSALDEIERIVDKYTYDEIRELRYNVAKKSVNAKIGKTSIINTCKEFVNISYQSLKNNCENEEQYLVPLIKILDKGKCPADV